MFATIPPLALLQRYISIPIVPSPHNSPCSKSSWTRHSSPSQPSNLSSSPCCPRSVRALRRPCKTQASERALRKSTASQTACVRVGMCSCPSFMSSTRHSRVQWQRPYGRKLALCRRHREPECREVQPHSKHQLKYVSFQRPILLALTVRYVGPGTALGWHNYACAYGGKDEGRAIANKSDD